MTDYTAPAAFVLTVVHIKDAARSARAESPGQDATYGETLCGVEMKARELWQLINIEPGDRVCPACLDPAAAAMEQGALL